MVLCSELTASRKSLHAGPVKGETAMGYGLAKISQIEELCQLTRIALIWTLVVCFNSYLDFMMG